MGVTNIFQNNIYFRTPEGKRAISFTIPVRTIPARIPRIPRIPRVNTNLTDGGRVGEGFTHESKDCAVRALAILKGWTYAKSHSYWESKGRKPNDGVYWHQNCGDAGVQKVPGINGGSIGKVLASLPKGRFVIRVRHHVFAVIDGVPQDTFCPNARGHVKAVYQNKT